MSHLVKVNSDFFSLQCNTSALTDLGAIYPYDDEIQQKSFFSLQSRFEHETYFDSSQIMIMFMTERRLCKMWVQKSAVMTSVKFCQMKKTGRVRLSFLKNH